MHEGRHPVVWLVLPAYNEGSNLSVLLKRVAAARSAGVPFQALVVDDGSSDDTASVATAAGRSLPLVLLRHERNLGLAAAVRTGIEEACRRSAEDDVIVLMDADNTHPPELVSAMIAEINAGNDIVVASRFVRGGRMQGVPRSRHILSVGASMVFRVVWRLKGVRDYTTGFRAYRAALLQRLCSLYGPRLIETSGFSVMTEILIKSRALAPRIAEVPMVLRYDLKEGSSKMRIVSTLRDYARLFFRDRSARSVVAPVRPQSDSGQTRSLDSD